MKTSEEQCSERTIRVSPMLHTVCAPTGRVSERTRPLACTPAARRTPAHLHLALRKSLYRLRCAEVASVLNWVSHFGLAARKHKTNQNVQNPDLQKFMPNPVPITNPKSCSKPLLRSYGNVIIPHRAHPASFMEKSTELLRTSPKSSLTRILPNVTP